MNHNICSEKDCERPVVGRGFCRKHYLQKWRAGTLADAPTRDRALPECPADHAHDLLTCWMDHGCRCDRCRHLRKMERQRHRVRQHAYGREPEPRVPATIVRDHLVALQNAGFGLERIADAAQVSRSIVLDVFFGPRGAEKLNRESDITKRSVAATTAQRILTVEASDIDAALVSPVGTLRRLRALIAIGYTQAELAEAMGMLVSNFSSLLLGRRNRITSSTYETACKVFGERWEHPQLGRAADRSRRQAKAARWVGPLAWDDIDDPAETPKVNVKFEGDLDEVAIELAMAGEKVKLTSPERREVVTRLHGLRWSDKRIADSLHMPGRSVFRIRQELGLKAFPQDELVQRGVAA